MISKKIILTGSFGVGKTSLFSRFIFSSFSDKYLTTIGVKVNKKTINIDGRELSILLWDIAGEVSQDKVPTTYFLGAAGIVYVFDMSRPSTFENMAADIEFLQKLLPEAVLKIVGNKKDLFTDEQLSGFSEKNNVKVDIFTSAKTGENVEELFQAIGKEMLEIA